MPPRRSKIDTDVGRAVAVANVPTLQMVLVHLTGDLKWLEAPFLPTRPVGVSIHDSGGLGPPAQAAVRAAAADAIIRWRHGTPIAIPIPPRPLLLRMMATSVSEHVPDEYADLIYSMLTAEDHRTAARPVAAAPGFKVVVIGAGLSGLCAGIYLQSAGIEFAIVEKSARVGGTWLHNRYPGCGVDTPSHLYSFSFAPHDWSRYFADRDEILAYIEKVSLDFQLLPHIRFGTEVVTARYSVNDQEWFLDTLQRGGARETLRSNIVLSAVGAFSSPIIPTLPGLDSFRGPVAHTARWPEHVDLQDKRVAVVGTGASAMQVVTAIAATVQELTIYQRSPQWAVPLEKSFAGPVPDPIRRLITEVPLYRIWLRLREAWLFNDKPYPALLKDPTWHDPSHSLNRTSERLRKHLVAHIRSELGARVDLMERVVPSYPPFGKRMLLDHGWFRTLQRENVVLVTDPIRAVEPTGIVTTNGAEHPADVLILATGFDVVRFLSSIEVRGRSGETLREAWDDDNGCAYLGMAVPDFPNFFTLYGPHTQAGHGGSLIFAVEAQLAYIMDLIRQMTARHLGAVECRREVYDEYRRRIDDAHSRMVWTHPGMSTYYRNSVGRVVVNSPWRVVDFWRMTRTASLDDYSTESAREWVLPPSK